MSKVPTYEEIGAMAAAEDEKERKSIEGMRKWHNSPECKKMFAMAEKNGEDRPKIKVRKKV